MEESRENVGGGVGELTNVKCMFFFPQWANKAKQKEEVYLFKELRWKKYAAGKFTGFETDLFSAKFTLIREIW